MGCDNDFTSGKEVVNHVGVALRGRPRSQHISLVDMSLVDSQTGAATERRPYMSSFPFASN